MMQMIMDWEKAYNAKSQEEGARRALARKLFESSKSTENDERLATKANFFLKLSKELNY